MQLSDGRTVIADDAYLRESILDPNAKIVAGFEPNVMPNFKGQVSEENVIQLIGFIKSLVAERSGIATGFAATAGGHSSQSSGCSSDEHLDAPGAG